MDIIPNNARRVLIIGSEGRLGSHLCHHLRRRHHVIPLSRRHIDLRSRRSIHHALSNHQYDHVILTAAMTGVDDCEREPLLSRRINAEAPGWIADHCRVNGAHLTFISTDYVFDGESTTPRRELDLPNPINVYGASKLLGEHHVLSADPHNLVLRVSWLFGGSKPSFPEWVVGRALAKAEIHLAGDKVASPTYIPHLVRWMESLILSDELRPLSGILHLCNKGCCTWADWGQLCLDRAVAHGLLQQSHPVILVPLDAVRGLLARRPANSVLHTGRFQSLTNTHPQSWETSVDDFFKKFVFEHPVN